MRVKRIPIPGSPCVVPGSAEARVQKTSPSAEMKGLSFARSSSIFTADASGSTWCVRMKMPPRLMSGA